MITEEEVNKVVSKVMHPAIDHSLVNLGIVKNVKLIDQTVAIEFCFPFKRIPIAEQLIRLVEKPLEELDLIPVHKVSTMTNEERERFMQMEKNAWKGD